MRSWKRTLRRGLRAQDGGTAIEYGLIAGLIAAVVLAGATLIGTSLKDGFGHLGAAIGAIVN
jgi:pilus assembly protein Flp/PilA